MVELGDFHEFLQAIRTPQSGFVKALALGDKALTALRRKFLIDESVAAARADLGRCPTKSSSAGNGPGQLG